MGSPSPWTWVSKSLLVRTRRHQLDERYGFLKKLEVRLKGFVSLGHTWCKGRMWETGEGGECLVDLDLFSQIKMGRSQQPGSGVSLPPKRAS